MIASIRWFIESLIPSGNIKYQPLTIGHKPTEPSNTSKKRYNFNWFEKANPAISALKQLKPLQGSSTTNAWQHEEHTWILRFESWAQKFGVSESWTMGFEYRTLNSEVHWTPIVGFQALTSALCTLNLEFARPWTLRSKINSKTNPALLEF